MLLLLNATKKNPDFAIWDEPLQSSVLHARYLRRWGVGPNIEVWAQNLPKDWVPRQFEDPVELLSRFQDFYQRRIGHSYQEMGARCFKPGINPSDFELQNVLSSVAATGYTDVRHIAQNGHQNGVPVAPDRDLRFTRMREWPTEPVTQALPPDSSQLRGIETSTDDGVSNADRARDMQRWKKSGQTWQGAFLTPAQAQISEYFRLNDAAARKAHKAAVGRRLEHAKNTSDRNAKYDRVPGLTIPQAQLRPAARGKIWSWDSGSCKEMGRESIATQVGFNVENLKAAAKAIGFTDDRIMQMITDTGATHGTTNFPLACHFYPNHHGSARHLDEVSVMIKEKLAERHFAPLPGMADNNEAYAVCAPRPQTLPCIQIPMNGTEQKLKPAQFFLRESGLDFKPNVRGTMNGSSPHDGQSPNDHCELLEHLNMPWVTITHVADTISILSSTGSPIYMFKIDMRRAYQQLLMQPSQTWRQHLHWCWDDDHGTHCGFMRDLRMQWGAKASGSIYHRGVTTLLVKYITDCLLKKWLPKVECPKLKKWAADRMAAGMAGVQTMPASVDGFLDDFFFFISGTKSDRDLAHQVIMDAFTFLGFTISKSKFEEEGTLSQQGEVLGHGIDLGALERFVTKHKYARIEKIVKELLALDKWDRKEIESLVGVIQSVKHDVPRRWRLGDLYTLVYADGVPGHPDQVFASVRAKRSLAFVMDTLHLRSPLRYCPTRWPVPRAVMCDGAPLMDASTSVGYGGVLKIGSTVQYYRGTWPETVLSSGALRIDLLEALTVILTALTWGHTFSGHKVLFRSDNSGAVFGLNSMNSKCPAMKLIIDQWEAVQHHFGFEAMLFHVEGSRNRHSDIASRASAADVHKELHAELVSDGLTDFELEQVPVIWSAGNVSGDITTELLSLQPRH